MKRFEKIKHLLMTVLVFLISTVLMTGCGSKSSTGVDDTVTEGRFLDGPVEGLSYVAGSESGITDAQGRFTYSTGATVKFNIGDILIGEGTAQTTMTPVNLVQGAINEEDPTVINITRFLLTLDADGNPDNGITITEAMRNYGVGKSINFNQGITAFQNDVNVKNIIEGMTNGARSLVSSQEAQDHMNQTLLGILAGTYKGTYSGDNAGTWTVEVSSSGNIAGTGVSNTHGSFTLQGTVNSSGSMDCSGEIAMFGVTFVGYVNSSTGEVSGTWTSVTGDNGTYSGNKQ